MSKKASFIERHKKDKTNRKALIWTAAVAGAIVVIMAILIVLNK